MTVYEITVPQFIKTLSNLSTILDKASAFADTRKFDSKVLLSSRLAPDMLPFTKQIQIACDSAKGVVARLAGQEPPKHEDNETTIAELKARIDKTITFLKTIKPEHFQGAEKRVIPIGWMPGKGLIARDFLAQMAIPNFYFHATAAYAILRHNGLEIGKGDFLGHLEFLNM